MRVKDISPGCSGFIIASGKYFGVDGRVIAYVRKRYRTFIFYCPILYSLKSGVWVKFLTEKDLPFELMNKALYHDYKEAEEDAFNKYGKREKFIHSNIVADKNAEYLEPLRMVV